MWITFGVFLLVLGSVLMLGGLGRGLFAKSGTPANWKYAVAVGGIGICLVLVSFLMFHQGEGRGVERVPIAIAVILAGLVVMTVGTWLALWAPIAFRNTMGGWKLILIGVLVLVSGIVIMTMNTDAWSRPGEGKFRPVMDMPTWHHAFSRRIGPMPFGAFALVVLLAVNGLGLRRGLGGRALLGANIFILAALVALYALGPHVFSTW